MEKLCIFCTNCSIRDSRGYGSTLTGAWGAKGLACDKYHFSEDDTESPDSVEDIRVILLKAETCPDYEQVEV